MRRLSLLLLLAGCSLGPRYERPAQDIPGAFLEGAGGGVAAASWPAPDWWRGFQMPELDALIADARAHNQDIAAAAARIAQADAQVRVAGAPLLPSLDASGDFRYSRTGTSRGGGGSGFGVIPGIATVDTTGAGTAVGGTTTTTTGSTVISTGGSRSRYVDIRTYTAQLAVSYDLDLWGRNRALDQAARNSLVASRYDAETVALDVVTAVAQAYFQAIEFQDRLRIAERNLRDARRILAAYQARLAAGTANALDVSQQQALVAQVEAQVPSLRNGFAQQVLGLGILTGRPPERVTVAGGTLDALALPPVVPGLPSELLARRPDVANAEAQLVAQNANVRAARAAFFPQVSLTASGGLSSAALSSITGPGTLIASLGAAVTQSIFDNGERRGQLDREKGRFEELAANYRRTVLQAFTDTEQALAALRYTGEQEALVRQTVAVAQQSADIAQAQLRAGVSDIITALNVQNTLFSNLDLLAQVRFARVQALVNLYKALGGGWSLPSGAS